MARSASARPVPPPAAGRLLPDLPPGRAVGPEAENLIIRRLLEDGDRADLAWLFAAFGEPRVRRWLVERGGRQLSRRSRFFWCHVLGVEALEPLAPAAIHDDLWPL